MRTSLMSFAILSSFLLGGCEVALLGALLAGTSENAPMGDFAWDSSSYSGTNSLEARDGFLQGRVGDVEAPNSLDSSVDGYGGPDYVYLTSTVDRAERGAMMAMLDVWEVEGNEPAEVLENARAEDISVTGCSGRESGNWDYDVPGEVTTWETTREVEEDEETGESREVLHVEYEAELSDEAWNPLGGSVSGRRGETTVRGGFTVPFQREATVSAAQ